MLRAPGKAFHRARLLARRLLRAARSPEHAIEAELKSPWFQDYGIRSVIDVGANEGQFARWARQALPEAQIYSFEPLADCHRTLCEQFVGDDRFEAFDFALGAARGEFEMNRNEYSPSSSLLVLDDAHRRAFPFAARVDKQRVLVETLDGVLAQRTLAAPILLKLDVQGYETQVLAGASRMIARTHLILLELSLEQMYQGEPLFDEVYRSLYEAGFALRGVLDTLRSPRDRRPLQIDALFERRGAKAL